MLTINRRIDDGIFSPYGPTLQTKSASAKIRIGTVFFYFYSQEGKSQVLFLKTKYLFKELNNKQQQQKIHMFSFYSAFGNSVSSLEGAGYL